MAWGDSERYSRPPANPMHFLRGMPPVTPDPKMHMSIAQGANGLASHASVMNSWHEAEQRHRDFSDLKLASPMFMPGIIKESPRPNHAHGIFHGTS
jgi:hypothetical protein